MAYRLVGPFYEHVVQSAFVIDVCGPTWLCDEVLRSAHCWQIMLAGCMYCRMAALYLAVACSATFFKNRLLLLGMNAVTCKIDVVCFAQRLLRVRDDLSRTCYY